MLQLNELVITIVTLRELRGYVLSNFFRQFPFEGHETLCENLSCEEVWAIEDCE